MVLDKIDRKILAILQENGRLSNQEVAERVNLSSSPCLRRIKRLEKLGVIRQYGFTRSWPNWFGFIGVCERAVRKA